MGDLLRRDALAISDAWRDSLDLDARVAAGLADLPAGPVDVVALGKAARAMAGAATAYLGSRVRRRLVVSTPDPGDPDPTVLLGEHPVPGPASLAAGRAVRDFLDAGHPSGTTVWLVSGGASSLAALPEAPLTLADLGALWAAGLAAGVDITTLNRLRAATSGLAGGAALPHVHTPASRALVMVDTPTGAARWVASGLTYPYHPRTTDLEAVIERFALAGELAERVRAAGAARRAQSHRVRTVHRNVVIATPKDLRTPTVAAARARGYAPTVVPVMTGDVGLAAGDWATRLTRLAARGTPQALIGIGELTVALTGAGRGGRAQEFAWTLARHLADLERPVVVVARATDGQDHLPGVAGAWCDAGTWARARAAGGDPAALRARHDTYVGHQMLGQLLAGAPTGWNLCDLYLALLGPPTGLPGSRGSR
ncbi:MAG: DUF4147 domain-containing protein [Acidimicrobiales bacterium]